MVTGKPSTRLNLPADFTPVLLLGNRWGRLTCVGTEYPYMSCVYVYLAKLKHDSNRLLLAANETA